MLCYYVMLLCCVTCYVTMRLCCVTIKYHDFMISHTSQPSKWQHFMISGYCITSHAMTLPPQTSGLNASIHYLAIFAILAIFGYFGYFGHFGPFPDIRRAALASFSILGILAYLAIFAIFAIFGVFANDWQHLGLGPPEVWRWWSPFHDMVSKYDTIWDPFGHPHGMMITRIFMHFIYWWSISVWLCIYAFVLFIIIVNTCSQCVQFVSILCPFHDIWSRCQDFMSWGPQVVSKCVHFGTILGPILCRYLTCHVHHASKCSPWFPIPCLCGVTILPFGLSPWPPPGVSPWAPYGCPLYIYTRARRPV